MSWVGTARGAESYWTTTLVQLTVNGVDKGAASVLVHDDRVMIPVDTLRRAGFARVDGNVETIEGRSYADAGTLAPKVKFRYDENALSVALIADPDVLNGATVDLGSGAPANIEYLSNDSAFINYAVSAGNTQTASFVTEQGIGIDGRLFDNTMNVSPAGQLVRSSTSYTIDDRTALTRLTLGDAVEDGGMLGGAAQIAGVTYATNFAINPYFTPFPSERFAGVVTTPSTADIYVNGVLQRSVTLAPGPFDLENIPAVTGAGNTRVVIRNAFGETQELGAPYYLSQQLLHQGLSAYNVSAGLERDPVIDGLGGYSGPAVLGHWRYGVTDWATPGVFVAADGKRQAAGPEVTIGTRYGSFGFFGAGSEEDGASGGAASAQYGYQSFGFSVGAALTAQSANYATLNLDRSMDRELHRIDTFVGAPWGATDFTLDLTDARFRDAGISQQASLTGTRRLTDRTSLAVTLSHAVDQNLPTNNGIFVSLTVALGGDTNAIASENRDQTGGTATAQVEKALPIGEGWGYLAQAQAGNHPQQLADVQYQGRYGLYEVDASEQEGSKNFTGTVSGAVVAIGDRIMATRPIPDAFALIQVPGVPGVTGTLSHQNVGKTDSDGNLLVPGLISYYGNDLGIDDQDVPMGYDIGATDRVVAPPYRGGAIVTFPVRKLQAIEGTLELIEGSNAIAPVYGELTLTVGKGQATSPVGDRGEFYFESLPPGIYPATLDFKGRSCKFTVAIPKSDGRMLELGKLICRE